jgi:Fe-S-cluster-containing dehydrogenase component
MMEKRLLAFPDKCTGCHRCVYACSAEKEQQFRPSAARLGLHNFPVYGFSVPLVCFQCPKPECLEACPQGAITKNGVGVVVVDRHTCDGCGECAAACSYGMIALDEKGLAYKCDCCGGRPACVEECEPQALVFAAPDKEARKERGVQMKLRVTGDTPLAKQRSRAHSLLKAARSPLLG